MTRHAIHIRKSKTRAKRKRRIYKSERFRNKVHKVMSEFKRGTLRTRGGRKVTSRKQAIAIALSEGRRAVTGKRRRRSR